MDCDCCSFGKTPANERAPLTTFFRSYLKLTLRHPILVLLLAFLSVCLSVVVTATRLSFSTDRTQLLEPSHPIQKSYSEFRADFGGNSDLVVLVSGSPKSVRAAIDELGARLAQDSATFQDILYRLELPELARHSLYSLL